MRVLEQTLDKLVLENNAPRYRTFLGYFLLGFPLLLLAYVIYAQRSYLDCVRQIRNQVDCQYVQEYNFPVASREQFPLIGVKATRVYQEVFVSVDGERIVQNNVLVLGKDNYLYIENFRDSQAASDFTLQLEQFFQVGSQKSTIISQNSLDNFWKLVRSSDNVQYYLWGLLCVVSGGILLYDAVYSEIYIFSDRTGILTRQRRYFLFKRETDYLLERIIAGRVEPNKDRCGCSLPHIILTLSNQEEIVLNSRLLESISDGKPEQQLLEAIKKRLQRHSDRILA
jgi:hypothetical protein